METKTANPMIQVNRVDILKSVSLMSAFTPSPAQQQPGVGTTFEGVKMANHCFRKAPEEQTPALTDWNLNGGKKLPWRSSCRPEKSRP
jgi:hypothetical protein